MWEESPGAESWMLFVPLFLAWFQLLWVRRERNSCGMFLSPAVLCPLPRDSSTLDPMECMDTAEEQRVHSPPASLVPRIHVILAQKLQHINPLLPACLNEEESKTCECLNSGHTTCAHLSMTSEQILLCSQANASTAGFKFKSC